MLQHPTSMLWRLLGCMEDSFPNCSQSAFVLDSPILNPSLHGSSLARNPTPTPMPATLGDSPPLFFFASPTWPQLLENKFGMLMLKCLDVFF